MGSPVYKDLLITKDEDYEYAVMLNLKLPTKQLDRERVIGFSHEPRLTLGLNTPLIEKISESVSEYYISNTENLPDSFKEGFSFVCPSDYGKDMLKRHRSFKMSMILSLSNFMPGHSMRHILLRRILDSDMDIHFYANGLNRIYKDPRVKEFDWDIFNIPYENYEYQIVIENIIDNYWSSEKLTNCVIKGVIPIYYGSKKASDLFYPEGSINYLCDDPDKNFETIREIYNGGIYDYDLCVNARNKLYDNINLLEFLYNKFKL